MNYDSVLEHLGVIKNQMLIFGVLGAILFLIASKVLEGAVIQGFCVFIAAIAFVGAGAFYAYALFKLPSSRQELMFSKNAEVDIEDHYAKEAA